MALGELTLTVEAPELARVLANACVFTPLRDLQAQARLVFDYDTIEATGTDTYTVGRDIAEIDAGWQAVAYFNPPQKAGDALAELEKAARAFGKGRCTLRLFPDDCLQLLDGETVTATARVAAPNEPLWPLVDALMTRLGEREPFIPPAIAFAPDMLARFAKVKRPKDAAADFLMQSPGEPVLIRIGSTFSGAIMPIDREINAKHLGEDAGIFDAA